MKAIEVKTQAELEAACKAGNVAVVRAGMFSAYGSSQVTAYGSSQVRAYGSSQVTAVTKHGDAAKIKGGAVIKIVSPKTALQWCAFNGVETSAGVAILFKGVNSEFKANHNGFPYVPGTVPAAPDWDGGQRECGGGLHFSPTPFHTLSFNQSATKFIACPVRLKDMRKPQPGDTYPNKIKAKGLLCSGVGMRHQRQEDMISDATTFDGAEFFVSCEDVLHATTGRELNELRSRLANTRGILDEERRQIEGAINQRQSQLNYEAKGPQKARW